MVGRHKQNISPPKKITSNPPKHEISKKNHHLQKHVLRNNGIFDICVRFFFQEGFQNRAISFQHQNLALPTGCGNSQPSPWKTDAASSTWDAPGIKFACNPSLRGFCPRQCAPAASLGCQRYNKQENIMFSNPNNAWFKGKSRKFTLHLYCLIPPK